MSDNESGVFMAAKNNRNPGTPLDLGWVMIFHARTLADCPLLILEGIFISGQANTFRAGRPCDVPRDRP